LVLSWGKGDKAAFEQLTQVVYDELRKVAETCLRLVDVNRVVWQNRAHFFAIVDRRPETA
jgi:hypothetical protein